MALKDIIKSLEEVDEKYRDLYEQKGEEFVFKGLDQTETKKKLDEFRNTNRTYHKQLEEMQKKMKAFEEAGVDLEQWNQAKGLLKEKEAAADKELIDKGKFEEFFTKRSEAMRGEYDLKLKAKEEAYKEAQRERDTLKQKLGTHLIDAEIQKAVMKAGKLREGAIDDVIARARKVWHLDEHGNILPKKSGETAYGRDGEVLGMEEWATDLITEAPHLFEASKGGGAEGGGTVSKDKTKFIDSTDPLAFGKNLEAIAKGQIQVR